MKLMDINTDGVDTSSYQHLEDLLDQHGKYNMIIVKKIFVVDKTIKKGEFTLSSSYS